MQCCQLLDLTTHTQIARGSSVMPTPLFGFCLNQTGREYGLRRTERKPLFPPFFYCKLKFCSFFRLILRETSGSLSPLEQWPRVILCRSAVRARDNEQVSNGLLRLSRPRQDGLSQSIRDHRRRVHPGRVVKASRRKDSASYCCNLKNKKIRG